jgi:transketolase
MKHTISELEDIASQVRRDCLRMVHAVQSGHPGASLGCADFFTALYFEVLNHNPKFSNGWSWGRFIFPFKRTHFTGLV